MIMKTIQHACCSDYRDEVRKDNKTKQDSVDELWERPLREHEVKVLRSKVQNHKHKKHSGKVEASVKKDATSQNTEKKKSSHLHRILKSKTTPKTFTHAKTSDKAMKHAKADARSMVFKENQLKPQLDNAYRVNEADVLEGDDDEGDMLPYSRGESFKVVR